MFNAIKIVKNAHKLKYGRIGTYLQKGYIPLKWYKKSLSSEISRGIFGTLKKITISLSFLDRARVNYYTLYRRVFVTRACEKFFKFSHFIYSCIHFICARSVNAGIISHTLY